MRLLTTFELLLLVLLLPTVSTAQVLQPGFDKSEYMETLKINQKAHVATEKWITDTLVPPPQDYQFVYRSPQVGFDNSWDLWKHRNKAVAMIAVRGTTPTEASFLANLYAAMVPASGELELEKEFTFRYHLADDSAAAVHVGWLISLAYLSATIEHQIDSCYRAGIRDFILTGHSQGGGIIYLLTSHLEHQKASGKLPQDIRFKTYCSAAPKPGNLFYAYQYESLTRDWAFNVVNTADWVPDVPFSVQTVNDFPVMNPFRNAKKAIRKQKFPKNVALKHAYNRMSKPSLKAQRNYQRYLGKMVSQAVRKQFPDYKVADYYNSNHYVRTGVTIPLCADEVYYTIYPNDPNSANIWHHHLPKNYLSLAERLLD